MLRINLLPAYIKEQRLTRLFIVAFGFLFAGVTAGMLFWWFTFTNQVTAREQAANEQEVLAQQVTTLVTETQTIRAGVLPIKLKRDFADAVLFYNGWKQKVYRRIAQYTTPNVEYSGMTISGDSLSISARAKKLDDIGRYMITMFGNPDVRAVAISGIPGWTDPQGQPNTGGFPGGGVPGAGIPGGRNSIGAATPGDIGGGGAPGGLPLGGAPPGGFGVGSTGPQQGFPFTVAVQLLQPIVVPDIPAGLVGGAAGGAPGFGGPFGGVPGGDFPGAAPMGAPGPDMTGGGVPTDR